MTAPRGAAFDGVAEHYDVRFSSQPIARYLRTQIRDRVTPLLRPGQPVLEIGCGTGEDACWFAARGHPVLATDVSGAMLEETGRKASAFPEGGRVTVAAWDASAPPPPEVVRGGPYALVFSNFGAINCIADMRSLGEALSRVTVPGGHVVLVSINRWCLMEVILNGLMGRGSAMTRRLGSSGEAQLEDGTRLAVSYHSVRSLAEALNPGFELVHREAIGVFLAPSEFYGSIQRRARVHGLFERLDRLFGRAWPFSRLGDHTLTVFRRTRVMRTGDGSTSAPREHRSGHGTARTG